MDIINTGIIYLVYIRIGQNVYGVVDSVCKTEEVAKEWIERHKKSGQDYHIVKRFVWGKVK